MSKFSAVIILVGCTFLLGISLSSADDSDEFFRGGRNNWDDSDESDERFGGVRRFFAPAPTHRRTNQNRWRSSSVSTPSWRRRDDSDESDERWRGASASRWARPARTRNVWNNGRNTNNLRQSKKQNTSWNAGRPLSSTNSIWSNNNNNAWSNRQSKWANTNNNKWQRNNKWNKWNSSGNNRSQRKQKNNSWNRKWW